MSLIEVMIALALFAVFASSLFIMQQYAFERMIISRLKVIAGLRMEEELALYQANIFKELYDYEQGSVKKALEPREKDFTSPDMTVTITSQPTFSEEQDGALPLKKFKNLYLITAQAHNVDDKDTLYGKMFMFMHIVELEKPKDK